MPAASSWASWRGLGRPGSEPDSSEGPSSQGPSSRRPLLSLGHSRSPILFLRLSLRKFGNTTAQCCMSRGALGGGFGRALGGGLGPAARAAAVLGKSVSATARALRRLIRRRSVRRTWRRRSAAPFLAPLCLRDTGHPEVLGEHLTALALLARGLAKLGLRPPIVRIPRVGSGAECSNWASASRVLSVFAPPEYTFTVAPPPN
jgi:hypothetical protein